LVELEPGAPSRRRGRATNVPSDTSILVLN